MSVRPLLQWLAGLALALALLVGWTSPGEAHAGHGASAATQEQAAASGPDRTDAAVAGDQSDRSAKVSEPACVGHGSVADGSGGACCSNSCHAVMSTDLGLPVTLSMALAVAPHAPEPFVLQGLSVHIKRPPRRLAALIG